MGNRADSFNRADAALLGSTPSDGGSAWSGGGTFNITSNQVVGSAGGSWIPVVLEASTNQVDITATAVAITNGGLVLRYADANNFLLAQVISTGLGLYRRVAGTFTQIGSLYSGTISAGSTIRASVDSADSISVYHNGTLRIGPVTHNAGAANTKHGLVVFTAITWDGWSLTDTASAGTPVGMATGTDTALALSGSQLRAVGLATETDTALALSAGAAAAVGLAAESDQALALAGKQSRAVGLSAETDAALARTAVQSRAVGLTAETDAALALTPGAAPGTVGLASETDQALPLTGRQILAVGLAVEQDQALALSPGSGALVGMALEIDAAFALQAIQRRPVGLAVESDAALALLPLGATPADSLARFTIRAQARRLSIAATARRLEIGR